MKNYYENFNLKDEYKGWSIPYRILFGGNGPACSTLYFENYNNSSRGITKHFRKSI